MKIVETEILYLQDIDYHTETIIYTPTKVHKVRNPKSGKLHFYLESKKGDLIRIPDKEWTTLWGKSLEILNSLEK